MNPYALFVFLEDRIYRIIDAADRAICKLRGVPYEEDETEQTFSGPDALSEEDATSLEDAELKYEERCIAYLETKRKYKK